MLKLVGDSMVRTKKIALHKIFTNFERKIKFLQWRKPGKKKTTDIIRSKSYQLLKVFLKSVGRPLVIGNINIEASLPLE